MNRTIQFTLAGLMCISLGAQAEVYRWVDKDGKLVFSQTPPPKDIQAEKITVNAPPPATPEADQKPEMSEETLKKVKGNPALDPNLRKEYCEKAHKNLKVLEAAKPGMGFVTENNELIKLDKEGIQLKIKETEAVIKAYCD